MSTLRNPCRHDDLLNYRLKRLLAIGGAPAIRLCEGRYGVTRLEWRIVAALVEGGSVAPSTLAERAHLEPARVSQTITRLVAKGLVERIELPGDRRRATVQASATGEQLYAQLFPQLAQINQRIVAALTEEEAAHLEHCLLKLTERAQQIYDDGGGVEARANRHLGGSQRFWR